MRRFTETIFGESQKVNSDRQDFTPGLTRPILISKKNSSNSEIKNLFSIQKMSNKLYLQRAPVLMSQSKFLLMTKMYEIVLQILDSNSLIPSMTLKSFGVSDLSVKAFSSKLRLKTFT